MTQSMQYFLRRFVWLSLSIVIFIAPRISLAQFHHTDANSSLELMPLHIGDAAILAEIADTARHRQIGLMHRRFMPEHAICLQGTPNTLLLDAQHPYSTEYCLS